MVQVKEQPLPFEGCGVRCGGRHRGDWLSLFTALYLALLPDPAEQERPQPITGG